MIDRRAEGFQIVMNNLRDFESRRIETVNDTAFIQRTALRGGHPQRILLLAIGHFVCALADGFAQQFFCSLRSKR